MRNSPRSKMDKELPVKHAAGTERADQWAPPSPEGGNLTMHDNFDLQPYHVASFMGMSGEPNNQSTDRPKGST